MIGQAIRDLRHASRMILRMPALAAVIIGSLGVGIGANTVVFSWIQAVVLNPIAGVRGASAFQLVEPKSDTGMYLGTSWPEYRDLRERLRAIDGLIAYRMIPLYVGERGRVERAHRNQHQGHDHDGRPCESRPCQARPGPLRCIGGHDHSS